MPAARLRPPLVVALLCALLAVTGCAGQRTVSCEGKVCDVSLTGDRSKVTVDALKTVVILEGVRHASDDDSARLQVNSERVELSVHDSRTVAQVVVRLDKIVDQTAYLHLEPAS